MTSRPSIVSAALAAVSSGIDDFFQLVDHLLARTDLEAEALAAGEPPDEYLFFLLEEDARILVTDDDEVIRLDELGDGLVFTRRVSTEEVTGDMLDVVPDLSLLDLGSGELSTPAGPLRLEFGWTERSPYSAHGSWAGPNGWLSGFTPGDLIVFRRVGDHVVVEAPTEVGDGEAEVAALRDAFEIGYDEGIGEDPEYLLRQAVLADSALFRSPVRPVSELLVDAGLSIQGTFVGPTDTEWVPPAAAAAEAFRSHLRQVYGFNACCDDAFDLVVDAWTAHLAGRDLPARSVNRALRHGSVVEAFSEWIDRYGSLGSAAVRDFVTALVVSGRRDSAPALMLRARNYEAAGETLAAEADLEEAIAADPDFGPALAELAWYSADRGDVTRVISLLRRAGVDNDDRWLSFHESLGSRVHEVGRNEPCPCGSGRKYKQCHRGRPEISARDRVTWLLSKLTVFATRDEQRSRLIGLASSAMWDDFEIVDLARMSHDEFIVELAVFEGGLLSEFIERRGMLVPDDEAEILASWENRGLALWEMESTDGVSVVTLRDTKTGQVETVTDRSTANRFRPGDQVLARLLPAWGEMWFSGVMVPVVPQHRASLMQILDHYHDADILADWYGSLHAPPRMANREGEPLVLCEARLRPTAGWDTLVAALDEHYERTDTDENVWHEFVAIDDEERVIRAVLRRHDDELEVEVNSEPRLDRVLDELAGVAEVVFTTSRPIGSARQIQEMLAESPPPQAPPSLDPEFAAEIRGRMERRWLEEEIPALAGMTPRQAAADPTRREDLIALLRSFENYPGNELSMRPEVIREHLGLED
ncbi:MAG: SEC-C metal-binding domain-containing protein [Acidimicrobiia bacterium]